MAAQDESPGSGGKKIPFCNPPFTKKRFCKRGSFTASLSSGNAAPAVADDYEDEEGCETGERAETGTLGMGSVRDPFFFGKFN